uniref:Pellino E3 ubiquitin protein ligase 1b n=1 Tax=Xiphophorus couchianus TaxID=32473 RepID=A0A3B5M3H4_9TELE
MCGQGSSKKNFGRPSESLKTILRGRKSGSLEREDSLKLFSVLSCQKHTKFSGAGLSTTCLLCDLKRQEHREAHCDGKYRPVEEGRFNAALNWNTVNFVFFSPFSASVVIHHPFLVSHQAISNKDQHSISYTLSRAQTVVVEYTHDSNTDMFQIGRSTESPIDFVVTDTVAGSQSNSDTQSVQSTISRFACRIMCQRAPPYTARIYAAGFDSSKNIFLGEKAAKWKTSDGQMDGLTTNGVLVMHPRSGFMQDSKPGVWREISVCGNVFTLRETRSAQQRGKMVETETQELVDGSLIDLCGAALLWRTAEGLSRTPTLKHLEALRQEINAARPQCPVGFNTLAFPSMRRKDTPDEKQPWVYLQCGHVHGYHNWGNHREEREGREGRLRECPMCRAKGPYVPLWLGCEAGFYVDAAPPTHTFSPCGHVCSEKTATFWSQIPLPHGTHTFHAACPFCAQQLSGEQGYIRLIFQGPLD